MCIPMCKYVQYLYILWATAHADYKKKREEKARFFKNALEIKEDININMYNQIRVFFKWEKRCIPGYIKSIRYSY